MVGQETEKYLRIVSLSIAGYDYLITLPAEVRFYRSQSNILRPSLGCVLFVLIRYLSIIVMVVSNYGVLATAFTTETCHQYYLIAPVFKVLQSMASQVILGVRTFNIARRQQSVGVALAIAFVLTTIVSFVFLWAPRVPLNTCTPGNSGSTPTAWTYYLISIIWDTGTLSISTFYLVRYNSIHGRLSRLIRTMIYDGLGYFLALTGVNVFNLILYRASNPAVQSAGASMGYAVTWIMSQRILIHLREMSEPAELARFENIILSRPLHPGRDIVAAFRNPDEIQKTPIDMEYAPSTPRELDLDVRVHVEQSVTVEYDQSSKRRLLQGRGSREAA
ncbi:hypothetical protein JVU11DRAFT_8006 [Chiua virens]|nr:hypothetical protein JVU11DRAFT_8006 [Chiua virens]